MDRGEISSSTSRLMTLLQTLEKLNSQRSTSKFTPEDLQQLRYATSKIHQFVSTQEKVHRDAILKTPAHIDLLLNTLQYSADLATEQNIIYILQELIGKTNTAKRVQTLVGAGTTHILLQTLVYNAKEPCVTDEFLVSLHQVLAKLGVKDRKIGVKARLTQALGVTLHLVKTLIGNPKLLQPVLHVLKIYSANAVNASYLGKNGAVSHLFKILSICGRKHLTLVKYTLDTLGLLVKSKSNSARAIGQGGVPVLLTMFYDWHRVDSKNRHINLRKSILTVLKHITNLKSGRKALTDAEGIKILYTTCQDSIVCRELESIIFLASLIMRKCFPRNRLPISNLRNPIGYPLPESDFHVIDSGEGQEAARLMNMVGETGDENGYESSVDDDDDISSDDDADVNKGESDDDMLSNMANHSGRRTWDDLSMYKQFFQELYDFDIILDDDPTYTSEQPIVIPTALFDGASKTERSVTRSQSSCFSQSTLGGRCESRNNSVPNFTSLTDEALGSSLMGVRVSRPSTRDGGSRSGSSVGYVLDAASTQVLPSASAVNLKTGQSVFSLDFPAQSNRKQAQNKSPKVRKNSKSSKLQSGNNNKRTSTTKVKCKTEDWLPVSDYSPSTSPLGVDTLDDDEKEEDTFCSPSIYAEIAAKTKSAGRFNKLAYPDMYGHLPPPFKEPLFDKKFGTQRQKVFEDIDRFINTEQVYGNVIYDLDSIVYTAGPTYSYKYSNLINRDQLKVESKNELTDTLKFNSQFESGNLRKVIQVRNYEYDLILNPDVNTNHHHQWFYFEVSNMEAGVQYRFNIVNFEKLNSQFNFGMQPVMFSVEEAMNGNPHWVRVGSEICYYKNHYVRSSQTTGGIKGKSYYTGTFTLEFKHTSDVCYLAYHYPYTYTMLQTHLFKLENTYDSSDIYFRNQTLCETLGGNSVPVLTITSHPHSYDKEGVEQLKNRPYMFLSGRVHPGESNSSWVMKGTIHYLLSDKAGARALRDQYIFKIVPMLNPDGVINGNHRCSLVAEDLNRRWLMPCPKLHPTIFHCKGLLQYLQMINKTPLVYCDYHGHSRRKNVFLYGCSPSLSWMMDDVDNPAYIAPKIEDTGYKTLPRVLQNMAPAFSLNNCSFMVEKAKEASARVVVWRQIGIVRSYTMESSYCGCDQGPYKGQHISTRELEEMGRKFCDGLLKIKSRRNNGRAQYRDPLPPYNIVSSDVQDTAQSQITNCDEDFDEAIMSLEKDREVRSSSEDCESVEEDDELDELREIEAAQFLDD